MIDAVEVVDKQQIPFSIAGHHCNSPEPPLLDMFNEKQSDADVYVFLPSLEMIGPEGYQFDDVNSLAFCYNQKMEREIEKPVLSKFE